MKIENKKQRIVIFLILGFLISSSTSFAQKFYADIKAGYGFPILSENITLWDIPADNLRVSKNTKLSYGKGSVVGVNMGYMINPYIGVDLGVGYKHGTNTFTLSTDQSIPNFYYQDENTYFSRSLQFAISVVLTSGFKQWNPYCKIGVLGSYGINTNIKKSGSYYYNSGAQKEHTINIRKFKGVKGIGAQVAIGITYTVQEYLSLFAELNVDALTCTADRSELIKSDISFENGNHIDLLKNKSYRDKYTKYVNELTFSSQNAPSQDEALLELKTKLPYSSIGVNLGVKFRF